MANVWPGVKGFFAIAANTAVGSASTSLNVPEGCTAVTLYVPALTATVTLTVQSLSMVDQTTWADATFMAEAGTFTTVDGIVAGVVTIPAWYLGGGTIRLTVAVTTQVAAVNVGALFNVA